MTETQTGPMTETTSSALKAAMAYYRAWTSHDFQRAMPLLAPDGIITEIRIIFDRAPFIAARRTGQPA